MLTRRRVLINALSVGCAALVLQGVPAALSLDRAVAAPASTDAGPPVPEPYELIDLVRNTVLAVDQGNKTGDYAAVHKIAGQAFNDAYPPGTLTGLFAGLRADGIDLGLVKNKVPLTSRPPTLDLNGRLRILGFFEFPGKQLVYDLLYDYVPSSGTDAGASPGPKSGPTAGSWRLAAIALRPRTLAPQPELLQPQ